MRFHCFAGAMMKQDRIYVTFGQPGESELGHRLFGFATANVYMDMICRRRDMRRYSYERLGHSGL